MALGGYLAGGGSDPTGDDARVFMINAPPDPASSGEGDLTDLPQHVGAALIGFTVDAR